MSSDDIWQLFAQTYLDTLLYVAHYLFEAGAAQGVRLAVQQQGVVRWLTGQGNGPVDAALLAVTRRYGVIKRWTQSAGIGQASGRVFAC